MRHHVVEPRYISVDLTAKLFLREDALQSKARQQAEKEIRQFFHPLTGGKDGKGWPFGRDVYVSDVYKVLEQVPGVDYVEAVELMPNDAWRVNRSRSTNGALMSITLYPDELVALKLDKNSFDLK